MKRKKFFIRICIIAVVVGIGAYAKEKSKGNKNLPNVSKKNLNYFKDNHEYEEIITYGEKDINNDGKKDLIVVYKKTKKYNEMVAVASDKDKLYITKAVLAPQEDVVITFKNIDDKDAMEVMVSGSKNGNVGYAIYSIENDKMIDLFGEGMNACC